LKEGFFFSSEKVCKQNLLNSLQRVFGPPFILSFKASEIDQILTVDVVVVVVAVAVVVVEKAFV
jgi:hypothetical protein